MKEVKVSLLDWDPASGVGESLRSTLHSCSRPIFQIRQESVLGTEPPEELSRWLARFHGSILFLVLSSTQMAQARSFLELARREGFEPPVVAALQGAHPEETLELLQLGAAEFLTPPLTPADLLPRVWKVLKRRSPDEILLHRMKKKIGLQSLVGKSRGFLAEVNKIPLVAKCDASVLISGETGTGKEIFARAVHYLSRRAGRPFIPVSCGAMPLDLMENELFGHVRGAYTGAADSQPGLVREAEGGTLFFDDIDCLSLPAQVKVLRLLQEKEYKELGSARYRQADLRVIAATNLDLEKAVDEGNFRQDLYYRLNIIPLLLPPLRERQEDIPLLARHFMEKHASEFHQPVQEIAPEAMQRLLVHPWPGNVRELENVIERAVVFSGGPAVQAGDIQIARPEAPRLSFKHAKAEAVKQFERRFIEGLLLANRGNISRAARAADKNRRAFWQLIRKYKIDVPAYKPGP